MNNAISNCDENADCKNTIGSYKCQCKTGFQGNGIICKGNNNYFYALIFSDIIILQILMNVLLDCMIVMRMPTVAIPKEASVALVKNPTLAMAQSAKVTIIIN